MNPNEYFQVKNKIRNKLQVKVKNIDISKNNFKYNTKIISF